MAHGVTFFVLTNSAGVIEPFFNCLKCLRTRNTLYGNLDYICSHLLCNNVSPVRYTRENHKLVQIKGLEFVPPYFMSI